MRLTYQRLNISLTGDLTMGGYISRKNSFIRRYRNGTKPLIANSYQIIYGTSQYSNNDLVTSSEINDSYTIVKAGRYKVSSNVLFGNGSYTDRMNWRLRLFKNGS
jgi:HKD family nuclease